MAYQASPVTLQLPNFSRFQYSPNPVFTERTEHHQPKEIVNNYSLVSGIKENCHWLKPEMLVNGVPVEEREDESDPDADPDSDPSLPSDLDELKRVVTDRLHLDARRPSIVEWMTRQQQRQQLGRFLKTPADADYMETTLDEDIRRDDEEWTPERVNGINNSLIRIRRELREMRRFDQRLARQLISLRSEIHRIKFGKSCTEYAELLEDVALALDERDELAELADLPPPVPGQPLRDIGVTRMNFLSARRFSLC